MSTTLPPSVVTRITLADDTIIELNDQNRIIGLNNHRHYLIGMEVIHLPNLRKGDYLKVSKGDNYGEFRQATVETIERL